MLPLPEVKRFLSISFVCAALAATLLALAVPHHHHGGETCLCATGHADHHDAPDTGGDGRCVAESEYTDRLERDCDGGFTSLCIECGDLSIPDIQLPQTVDTAGFGEHVIHYHSVDARSGGGLRAPPAILC